MVRGEEQRAHTKNNYYEADRHSSKLKRAAVTQSSSRTNYGEFSLKLCAICNSVEQFKMGLIVFCRATSVLNVSACKTSLRFLYALTANQFAACQVSVYLSMHVSTRTVGRLFGRNVTFRSSMNAMTPPGLSA